MAEFPPGGGVVGVRAGPVRRQRPEGRPPRAKREHLRGRPSHIDWVALKFDCHFGSGWQYLTIVPAPGIDPGRRKALTLWIDPISGTADDALRCRFTDTTGQTFQPDLGQLRASGWRRVIPLAGKIDGGHWGGTTTACPILRSTGTP